MTPLYGNVGGSQKAISSAFGNISGSQKEIFQLLHVWERYTISSEERYTITNDNTKVSEDQDVVVASNGYSNLLEYTVYYSMSYTYDNVGGHFYLVNPSKITFTGTNQQRKSIPYQSYFYAYTKTRTWTDPGELSKLYYTYGYTGSTPPTKIYLEAYTDATTSPEYLYMCKASQYNSYYLREMDPTGGVYYVDVCGTYVDEVTSLSSSAYPTDGSDGTYWYKYKGQMSR